MPLSFDSPFGQAQRIANQDETIKRLSSRLEDVGIDPALAEPRESLFSKALNFIDKPKQALLGVLDSAFIRGDIFEEGVGLGIERAFDERANFFDVLRRETDLDPVSRGALGLAGEIFLDPLNLISGGSHKAISVGGRAVTDKGADFFKVVREGIAKTSDVGLVGADLIADKKLFTNLAGLQDDLLEEARLLSRVGKEGGDLISLAKEGVDFGSAEIIKLTNRIANRKDSIREVAKMAGLDELSIEKLMSAEGVGEVFKKPSIKFSTSIPFIGERSKGLQASLSDEMEAVFQNNVKEMLEPEFSPLRQKVREGAKQVFTVAGDIINPKEITLGEVEIPHQVIEAFQNVKQSIKDRFSGFSKASDAVLDKAIASEIPGVELAATFTKTAKNGTQKLAKGFAKAFSNRFALGSKNAADITVDWMHDDAAVALIADDTTRRLFGQLEDGRYLVDDPESAILLQGISQKIEGLGGLKVDEFLGAIDDIKEVDPNLGRELDYALQGLTIARHNSALPIDSVIERIKNIENLAITKHQDILKNRLGLADEVELTGLGFEDMFLAKLKQAADRAEAAGQYGQIGVTRRLQPQGTIPGITGKVDVQQAGSPLLEGVDELSKQEVDLIRKVTAAFTDLKIREENMGIGSGFVDAYIPHLYQNLDTKKKFSNSEKAFFQSQRKFKDLHEAFKSRGLVGETNIAELYKRRLIASLKAQGKKSYFQRMALEAGIDAPTYKKLFDEAATNPAVREMLTREGFNAPTFNTMGEMVEQLKSMRGGFLTKNIQLINADADMLNMVEQYGGGVGRFMDDFNGAVHDLEKAVIDAGLESKQKRHIQAFGEWAGSRVVKTDQWVDGKRITKEFVMPTDIANAMDEITSHKDIIRDMLPKGGVAEDFLNAMDATTNMFKRIFTVPWISYWSQNVAGDTLYRLADGGFAAINPGVMARTMRLLDGSGSIMLKSGEEITPAMFQQFLRKSGLTFNREEFLDVIKAHANSDLEIRVAKSRGIAKNLKIGKDAEFKPGVAMQVASDFMRDNFENFFRVNHLVHHMEHGISMADALRRTNDALIDYRNLTPFERSVARRFYMFYGWISKSSKKTLNQLFFQPGALQQQIKSAQALAETFSDPNALPSYEEVDSKALASMLGSEQLSFALGRGPTGEKITGRGFGLPLNTPGAQFSLQLPRNFTVGEIIGAGLDSATRTAQKQFASANPFIKSTAEIVTGRNLYFDRPLNAKFLRKIPSLEAAGRKLAGFSHDSVPSQVFQGLDDVAKSFLGGVPDGKGNMIIDPGKMWLLANFIPGFSRLVSTGRGFADDRTDVSHGLLRALTGVRIEEGDIERTYQFDQLENLKDLTLDTSLKEREIQAGIRDGNGKLIKKKDLIN